MSQMQCEHCGPHRLRTHDHRRRGGGHVALRPALQEQRDGPAEDTQVEHRPPQISGGWQLVVGEGQETEHPNRPGQGLHQGERLHRLGFHPASQEDDVEGEEHRPQQRDGRAEPEPVIPAAVIPESQDADPGQRQGHRYPGAPIFKTYECK